MWNRFPPCSCSISPARSPITPKASPRTVSRTSLPRPSLKLLPRSKPRRSSKFQGHICLSCPCSISFFLQRRANVLLRNYPFAHDLPIIAVELHDRGGQIPRRFARIDDERQAVAHLLEEIDGRCAG